MSEEEREQPQLGMPVAEVVAYLSELTAHLNMLSERIVGQIQILSDACDAAAEAQDLADASTPDVD